MDRHNKRPESLDTTDIGDSGARLRAVSVQRTGGHVTVKQAGRTLAGMLRTLGARHRFLPDDRPGTSFPEWCHHASRTTDAHLLQLAEAHRARLATLDTSVPGGFLVPGSADTR